MTIKLAACQVGLRGGPARLGAPSAIRFRSGQESERRAQESPKLAQYLGERWRRGRGWAAPDERLPLALPGRNRCEVVRKHGNGQRRQGRTALGEGLADGRAKRLHVER